MGDYEAVVDRRTPFEVVRDEYLAQDYTLDELFPVYRCHAYYEQMTKANWVTHDSYGNPYSIAERFSDVCYISPVRKIEGPDFGIGSRAPHFRDVARNVPLIRINRITPSIEQKDYLKSIFEMEVYNVPDWRVVLATFALLLVIYHFLPTVSLPRNVVPERIENESMELYSLLHTDYSEAADFEDKPNEYTLHKIKRKQKSFIALLASEAKVKFGGTPKLTEANRLAVGKFLADHMKERKMRPTHIIKMLPIAVALTFQYTKYEENARQMLATKRQVRSHEIVNVIGWGYAALIESSILWFRNRYAFRPGRTMEDK